MYKAREHMGTALTQMKNRNVFIRWKKATGSTLKMGQKKNNEQTSNKTIEQTRKPKTLAVPIC